MHRFPSSKMLNEVEERARGGVKKTEAADKSRNINRFLTN
jgi:hypothetical protein